MKADIYNWNNEVVGSVELPDALFGAAWRPSLVHQVLTAQEANARSPWAHAKGRGEVRGGGRKPWKQKGTGQARHGSRRSPIWAHGGVAHGPSKDRDYSEKVNKKMKAGALASVLSKKLKDNEIRVVESLAMSTAKTKDFAALARPMVGATKRQKNLNLLLVPATGEKNLFRAARNVPKTKVLGANSLNVKDILMYRTVFLDKATIETIAKTYIR